MKAGTIFIAFLLSLLSWNSVKAHGSMENVVAESGLVVSAESTCAKGIIPLPVSAAENVPSGLRSLFPFNKIPGLSSLGKHLSVHQHLAYYNFAQPILYHESPKLFIALCLLRV